MIKDWEWRVIRKHPDVELGVDYYQVSEIYYDENDKITLYSQAIPPYGEDLEELRDELTRMLEATNKPVIDANDLPIEATVK